MADDEPLDCSTEALPSTGEYYAGPLAVIVPVILLDCLATIAIGAVYVSTIRYVHRHTPEVFRGYTCFVVSIYPVSASMALVAVVVPRTFPMVHLVIQVTFVLGLYQLFSLLVCHLGSTGQLAVNTLQPATGPCCCCSCYRRCLKPIPITRSSVMWLGLLVLQLPLVQWMIYLVRILIVFELGELVDGVYIATQMVFVASLVLAVLGTRMAVGALAAHLRATGKFLALLAPLLLDAHQSLVAAAFEDSLPCSVPLTPTFWINLTLSTLLLLEMVPLSLWARKLYCQETTPALTLGHQPRRGPLSAVEAAVNPGVDGANRGPAPDAVVTAQPTNHHMMEHVRDHADTSITA